jgi:hypothetical protein
LKHLAWACDGNGSTTGGIQQPSPQQQRQYVPPGSPAPVGAKVKFADEVGMGGGQPNGK